MKLIRRLYDWVLSWAETPWGAPVLFILSFAEASFFPVPPDVLLMALALARPKSAFRYALIASLGSVSGGVLGYMLGLGFWGVIEPWFYQYVPGFSAEGFEQVRTLFEQYGFWTIFAAGFTPIPYKIFTISAGVFNIGLPIFIAASLVGRSLRFFLVAATFYFFGRSARELIEKYFNLFSILLLVLIVILLIVIKVYS